MDVKDQQQMYDALKRIATGYQTPTEIRRDVARGKNYGLSYEAYLATAYENLQREAATAINGLCRPVASRRH